MGDVLTLIERAQESFDRAEQEKLQKKLQKATFDLEDFLNQLQQLKRMGPIGQLLEMIPGFNRIAKQLPTEALAGDQMKHVEAIIRSMTPAERRSPEIIDGSRRRRIARGSGTTPQDVNQLLGQFMDMRRMMKQMTTGGGRFGRMAAMLGQAGGPPELNGRGVHVPMPKKKERKKRKKHHARR